MGLDVVELVLECEEAFGIELEDWKLEQMRTVGDLFELICEQLHLPFGKDAPRPQGYFRLPLSTAPDEGWTRNTVWEKVVAICVNQLQVEPDEVKYHASFSEDLGAD